MGKSKTEIPIELQGTIDYIVINGQKVSIENVKSIKVGKNKVIKIVIGR